MIELTCKVMRVQKEGLTLLRQVEAELKRTFAAVLKRMTAFADGSNNSNR